jgi:tetratricopeptide (TPR) repeat protein
VKLQVTSDNDQQLRCLTDRFEKQAEGSEGWNRVGRLLVQVNQLDKATEVFNDFLNRATNEEQRATYYISMGSVYSKMGEYPKALSFYERVLAIVQRTLTANHLDFAVSYNSINSVYWEMGEYPKALSFHERALVI